MRFLVTALIVLFTSDSFSQDPGPVLNEFTVLENGKTVYLNWEIAQGFTCNGIRILRSEDGIQFDEIGEIDGVCGSTTEPVGYDFTDKNPIINKKSYYRLDFGGIEYSDIIAVELVDISDQGYQVRPNPASSDVRIYFQNDRNEKHELVLYDSRSKPFHQVSTTSNFFEVDVRNFPSAVYLFRIVKSTNETEIANGKVVVKH